MTVDRSNPQLCKTLTDLWVNLTPAILDKSVKSTRIAIHVFLTSLRPSALLTADQRLHPVTNAHPIVHLPPLITATGRATG